MDLNRQKRTEEALNFFKNKFKLELNKFPEQKTRFVLVELNRRLDRAIEEEKKRNMSLTQEIYTERNRIMALTEELYG